MNNMERYTQFKKEQLEKILCEFLELDYPKYHGSGIYEISKGCFTGDQGMKEFDNALIETFKKQNESL